MRLFESAGIEARLIAKEDLRGSSDLKSFRADAVLNLQIDGEMVHCLVEVRSRAPYPGEVEGLEPLRDAIETIGVPLLVAPYVSQPTGRMLTDAKWSWADALGNADIRARGVRINRRVPKPVANSEKSGIPTGTGSWTIIRSAIATGGVDGVTELAKQTGVSQPRVSQVLSHLTGAGFLEREGRSSWAADRSALLDAFLENYPGARGATSWLYSLDPPQHTCDQIISLARSSSCQAVVSGDVAADRLMPWRVPTHVTVYAAEHHLPTRLGLEAAIGPDDGNVEIIVPADTSVFLPFGSGDPLTAHPTQVIWDLQRLGGSDRLEAVERLSEWLLSR